MKQVADRRQTDVFYKTTPSRSENPEPGEQTWNRSKITVECKTKSPHGIEAKNYRMQKTEYRLKATVNRGMIITEGERQKANMESRQDHAESKTRIWNRGTTITECKIKLRRTLE